VKSTYVETYDQELFLKNMPKAIDTRIASETPILAKAIAAEHLIQVRLGSAAVPVIQATAGRSEFEDCLDLFGLSVGLLISHECPHWVA
jgi:hypothetical protein